MNAHQHIADRIQKTELDTRGGYPWMTVTDFLPADLYENIRINQDCQQLLDAHDDPNIVKALYSKFNDYPIRQDSIQSIYTFWQSTGAGYSLKPHEDSWPRVFTIVYYFPDDDTYPEAGTAIYEVDEDKRDYTTVATSPYLPNTATIIAPDTGRTWHGVDLIQRQVSRQSAVLVFSAEEWTPAQLHYADWKSGRTVNYAR